MASFTQAFSPRPKHKIRQWRQLPYIAELRVAFLAQAYLVPALDPFGVSLLYSNMTQLYLHICMAYSPIVGDRQQQPTNTPSLTLIRHDIFWVIDICFRKGKHATIERKRNQSRRTALAYPLGWNASALRSHCCIVILHPSSFTTFSLQPFSVSANHLYALCAQTQRTRLKRDLRST